MEHNICIFRSSPVVSDLESKLVEEVVDEVFDEADDAGVQVLPRDVVEDDPGGGGRQLVPQSEVSLVAVDGHLERQEGQHQQVVLHGRWQSSNTEFYFKYSFMLLIMHDEMPRFICLSHKHSDLKVQFDEMSTY